MPITGSVTVDELLVIANTYHEPEARDEGSGEGSDWLPAHDHLGNAEDAVDYLRRKNIRLGDRPNARQLAALRDIRDVARLLVTNRRAFERRAGRLLEGTTFRLDAGGRLHPIRTSWDGFHDGLLIALVELQEDAGRLKLCENDQCHWLFLDHSKNRSRQWCESSSCGNRQRVRRFRHRQGAA